MRIAGSLWGIIGLFLIFRGALLYQLAVEEQNSTRQVIIFSLIIGTIIGLAKGYFVLSKTAQRNRTRIQNLEAPIKIHHMYAKQFYGFIALMIFLGYLLRTLNGYIGGYVVVGAIYCGIGMALLISSRVYWKTEREIPAEETP